jgi:hypothetical protein
MLDLTMPTETDRDDSSPTPIRPELYNLEDESSALGLLVATIDQVR